MMMSPTRFYTVIKVGKQMVRDGFSLADATEETLRQAITFYDARGDQDTRNQIGRRLGHVQNGMRIN